MFFFVVIWDKMLNFFEQKIYYFLEFFNIILYNNIINIFFWRKVVRNLLENKGINDNQGAYFFHQGTNFYAYDYLGCHEGLKGNKYEYTFRVWAPNADRVELVSDFTAWDNGLDFYKVTDMGVWECVVSSDRRLVGSFYKFKITNNTKLNID